MLHSRIGTPLGDVRASLLRWRRPGIIALALMTVAISAAAGCGAPAAETPLDDGGRTTLAPTSQVKITALPTPESSEQAPGDSVPSPTVSPTTQTVQLPAVVAPEPTASESSGVVSAAPTETPPPVADTPTSAPPTPSATSIPPAPISTTVPPIPSPVPPQTGHNVGNSAPDFTVETVDGVTVSLTDYKQANQPVVVYFFATW